MNKSKTEKFLNFFDSTLSGNLKRIVFSIFVVIVLSIIGYLLLTAVYCIPTDGKIYTHTQQSAALLENESDFQPVAGNKVLLDNYTDSTMLLEAAAPRVCNAISDAGMNYYNSYPNLEQKEVLQDIYLYPNNPRDTNLDSYSRYWNGYLIFLKPLLLFMNYGWIRTLIATLQIILLGIILIMLVKDKREGVAMALVATYALMAPMALMMNMQLASCFILAFIGIILVLIVDKNFKEINFLHYLVFLILGCATSYFDFLTVPFIVCGLPLLILVSINKQPFKKTLCVIFGACFFWVLGYALLWFMKLALGSLLTGNDLFNAAISSFIERTSNTPSAAEASAAIPENRLAAFLKTVGLQIKFCISPALIIVVVCFLLLLIFCSAKSKTFDFQRFAIYLIIAALPLVWYFATINHSYEHVRFTFRLLSVSMFAAFLFCTESFYTYKRKALDAGA